MRYIPEEKSIVGLRHLACRHELVEGEQSFFCLVWKHNSSAIPSVSVSLCAPPASNVHLKKQHTRKIFPNEKRF